ncbi:MAG: electron transfer flavoprotein-ubiquinone oxidoreductase [Gammaproteobacteria bacterium]|nr:MAG: electron transfer flavoprotein-ubiquinone oxidoreductase [Gammaproteobacteria bacterium]
MEREAMNFDVVIIGAGPSGLTTAIRLAQLAQENERELTICILEKGAEVGAHILSGAVIEPRTLNELIPDWKEKGAPLNVPVKSDQFKYLTEKGSISMPTPPQMHNEGNYIISLGNFCRWLAELAEELGVEIFPGFAAAEVLYDKDGAVRGVATGDMGIGKDGEPTDNYEPGVELIGRQTIFAEGCRGSLTGELMQKFNLRDGAEPQTYGIGIKEIWDVKPEKHQQGATLHTIGWPLTSDTYGGSFLYHNENNQVAVGFVIGLDYKNPHLSPFEEFQRFKNHPDIRPIFEGGTRVAYGARAISEGGLQSIPKLTFPGGLLVGDTAGFLNVPKIKGTHTSMKSAMLAAEAVFELLPAEYDEENPGPALEASTYPEALKKSWLWQELHKVRNIRPGFQKGLWWGLFNAALESYVFRGKAPWTLGHHADHEQIGNKNDYPKIEYPKPDNEVSFDRSSSVYLSGAYHDDNQPAHLKLRDDSVPIALNLEKYDAPEQRYCPAGVYEIVEIEGNPALQINAQNCVHCKTCDIKDPSQNIHWTVPEGGGGPTYPNM